MSSVHPRSVGNWDAETVKQAIIPHIPTLAKEWGIKLTGTVTSKGWSECHAIDRDDSTPSAAINLRTGVYKDQGGSSESLSIFELAVKLGAFHDFSAAVNSLGDRYGASTKHGRPVVTASPSPFAGTAADGPPRAAKIPTRQGKTSFEEAISAVARTPKLRNVKAVYQTHWTYHNADGSEALRIVRYSTSAGKEYRPVHHEPGAGWLVADPIGPLPLYDLPLVTTADASRPVYVFEGEKVAELAKGLGLLATTSSHGAKSAGKSDWSPLAGREVVIVPDAGEAGERYKAEVVKLLLQLQPRPSVRVLELPGLAEGEDLEQWVERVPDGWDNEDCGRELHKLARTAIDPTSSIITEPEPGPATIPIPGRFDLGILGAVDFSNAVYAREWLVKRIMIKGKPGIIGGPKKSLKTSFVIDLVVSLGGGGQFLGQFDVPRPVRTLVISGESGEATIQETMRRVCRAKGVYPEDLEGNVFWGFTLPQLSSPEEMEALGLFIRAMGIECVIIDPLYLCLISGNRRVDMSNLFEVGPLLKAVCDLCLSSGATPLLVHHFRKGRQDPFDSPDMEDLAFAGIQEFARQWILLGRREAYVPGTGDHALWLSVGGSDGHSGEWSVDVSEGALHEDFRDRDWQIEITSAPEAIGKAKEKAAATKAEKIVEAAKAKDKAKDRQVHDDAESILSLLEKAPDKKRTARGLRDAVGCNADRIGRATDVLLRQGRIRLVDNVQVTGEDGKKRSFQGFEFVTNRLPES